MKKNSLALLSLGLLASAFLNETPKTINIKPEDIDITSKEPVIPNGCKKYVFGEFETIASSEKSARKKYDKWLKTKQLC